jgi:hypothetical protein
MLLSTPTLLTFELGERYLLALLESRLDQRQERELGQLQFQLV